MPTWTWGSGSQSTTAGTYTWTVPTGVYVTEVQLWGAGGGGGSSSVGGGGGGGYSQSNSVATTPGAVVTIVIGAGGAGGAGGASAFNNGGNGGASTYASTTVVANGGTGDTTQTGAAGGAAGTGANLAYTGGHAGNGDGLEPGGGGGGGGAAGPAGGGGTGGNSVADSGGTGGGSDGTGSGSGGHGGHSSTAGSAGGVAGGGGGGGGLFTGAHSLPNTAGGGNGAAGGGQLTWPTVNSVAFNGNGNTGGSMSTQFANNVQGLTLNAFTKTGYTFIGWATTSSGFPTYTDGVGYNFASGSLNLYAIWAQTELAGVATIGSYNPGYTGGFIVMSKFTAVATGVMTTIYIGTSGSGHVQVGVYTDSGGSPATLLCQVGTTAVQLGANAITVPNTNIISGSVYWIAENCDTTNLILVTAGGAGGTTLYKTLAYGTSFPNPAGSGYTSDTTNTDLMGFGTLGIPSGSTLLLIGTG